MAKKGKMSIYSMTKKSYSQGDDTMPFKIVTRYFDVVPLFRYKQIELKERLTIIFYMAGFGFSVIAVVTTFLLGKPFWVNIPNLLLLLSCLLLPFLYPNNFEKVVKIVLYSVAFIYLPISYYINGGDEGIGVLYFLMVVVYFNFFFDGKRLAKVISAVLALYVGIIIMGYIYPSLITYHVTDASRIIDIILSFVSISILISVVSNIIFYNYRIEKDNKEFLLKELKKQNNTLELLSTTDQLTEVYNRRHFLDALKSEFDHFELSKKHFYVMMIDLDDFKVVNDTYGHLYGDEILKGVAKAISSCLREHDIVARYGGEEFSVIISHNTLESGKMIAERIRKAVEDMKYRGENNITVSIGIVKNKANDTLLGIMKRSDNFLYEAKGKGKNRVEGK